MTPRLLPGLLHPTLGPNSPSAASWLGGAGEDGPGGPAFLRALSEARQAASPPLQAPPLPRPAAEATSSPESVREPAAEAPREPVRETVREPERPRAPRGSRAEGARDESAPADRTATGPREARAARGRDGQDAARPEAGVRQAAAAGRRGAAAEAASAAGRAPADDGDETTDFPGRARRGAHGVDGTRGGPGESGVAGADAAAGPIDPAAGSIDAAAGRATSLERNLRHGLDGLQAGASAASGPRLAKSGSGAEGAGDPAAAADAAERGPLPRAGAPRAGGEGSGTDLQALGLHSTASDLRGSATPLSPLAAATTTNGAHGTDPGAGSTALAGVAGASPFAGALAAAAGAGSAAAASPAREAALAAAPGSEAFARELGVQVSVFVRDGVQQARLHLNPQELGPVQVTIQLEGQAAHVRMAAEVPSTREALEQALPSLAGQLSEAGFTLAGGGVFERPSGQAAERGAGEPARRAPDPEGPQDLAAGDDARATSLEPGHWSRPRGLVDLLA